MHETNVAVVGTVLTEPRFREVGGHPVASFLVGSTARRYDRGTDRWVDGDRVVAAVNCWRRLAEGVRGVVAKSSPVVVSGRLRTREYELRGEWKTAVEIEAQAVGLDLSRSDRAAAPDGDSASPTGVPEPLAAARSG